MPTTLGAAEAVPEPKRTADAAATPIADVKPMEMIFCTCPNLRVRAMTAALTLVAVYCGSVYIATGAKRWF